MLALQQSYLDITAPPLALTPPLKWAGGKRWLVPRVQSIWQRHSSTSRLVEPFIGGMAVALGLQPAMALLNDVNPHLINLYRWLKHGLVVEIEMRNDRELYAQHRTRFNHLITIEQYRTAEAASLFYYLNRTGFNGLCRFNKSGLYNVPFGAYKTINYTRDFTHYAPVLRNWTITGGDFAALELCSTDFIYADPPYDCEFTSYSAGGFSWQDQERCAEWLAQHPGPVISSNQATPRIVDLYTALGFDVEIIEAPRRIACSGDRTPAKEILAMRNV